MTNRYSLIFIVGVNTNGYEHNGVETHFFSSIQELNKYIQNDLRRADLLYLDISIINSKSNINLLNYVNNHGSVCLSSNIKYLTNEKVRSQLNTLFNKSSNNCFKIKEAIDSSAYNDEYIARWGSTNFLANAENAADQIISRFPNNFDGNSYKVLDVGSLNGYIMESLRMAGLRNVFGTDISYSIAIKHTVNQQLFPYTRVGDFIKNDYPESYFDALICMEVLEHVNPSDTEKFVGELARVAKKNSRLLISASEDWGADDTHINCRNRTEWYTIFARHGLIPVGRQIIFPGFNSFVLQKKENSIMKFVYFAFFSVKQLFTGKMKMPQKNESAL